MKIFLLSSAGPDEAELIRMLTEESALEHKEEEKGEREKYSSLAQLVRAPDC